MRTLLLSLLLLCALNPIHAQAASTDEPFTLLSEGKISFKKASQITGLVGATGQIKLADQVQIVGDLFSSSDILAASGALIQGDTFTNVDLSETLQSINISPILGNSVDNGPLEDILLDKSGQTTLDPGNFGDVKLKKDSILTLTAGTYFFDNLKLAKGAKVIADTSQGDVLVNLIQKLKTAKQSEITHEGDSDFIISVDGKINIGKDNNIVADIVGLDKIKIGNFSSVKGHYYSSSNITVGKGVTVETPEAESTQVVIPEPATVLLLTASLPLLRYHRRRA